jgi:hypothetical protein
MKVLGIDPGKSGSFALLNDNCVIEVKSMPVIKMKGQKAQYDEREVFNIIKNSGADKIIIEKVNAMPGNGAAASFTFGFGFGLLVMAAACSGIPYSLVHPRRWKREMLCDIPGAGDDKARSVIAAKRLFPNVDFPLKQDHNKA